MRRILKGLSLLVLAVLITASTPLPFAPQATTVNGIEGVFPMGDSNGPRCTAVNVGYDAAAKTAYAYTASHCLIGAEFLPPFLVYAMNGTKTDAVITIIESVGDATRFSYPSATPVPYYLTSPVLPPFGGEILVMGLIYRSEDNYLVFIGKGYWTATRAAALLAEFPIPGRTYFVQLPGKAGFSGSPVFYQGRVIGLVSSGWSDGGMITGVVPLPPMVKHQGQPQ